MNIARGFHLTSRPHSFSFYDTLLCNNESESIKNYY
nr:MAG TPA: hypothetical protein [Caudoviricetes sp.]